MKRHSGKHCSPGRCRKHARLDPDVKALKGAIDWIEKSTSERMKRATAEFIYDRYVRNLPAQGGKT
jgi:hypothetical protein